MEGTGTFPLWLIAALPLAGAAFNLLIGRKLPRAVVSFVGVGVLVAACAISIAAVLELWTPFQQMMAAGDTGQLAGLTSKLWTWIEVGDLKLELAFRLDTLSAVMTLVVTFVGTWIHLYSVGYMADDDRYATYFGYLNLFSGAMLVLVLGDNLPVMFIGWEGVGLCSYLLIGFWFTVDQYAYAGRKAFIVNRIGDFAFLLGMCLLFWATKSLDFSAYHSPGVAKTFESTFLGGERLAAAAGILLFIGAAGKSAQFPLYIWLPDAMAGPTPVSALIHAATMVTAGVYMVARMSWLYMSSTTAMFVVATIGAFTALFAAIIAFAQNDIKKVLAYSTVSQLGFMFVAVGVGAYVAGIFHLVTHAFFKAGLFLGAGSVMHAMSGSGDITIMGGLRRKLPITHATFLICCIAIAGIPPLAGFFSKDEILAGAFSVHLQGWPPLYGKLLYGVLTLAAFCTAFYMFRLYFLVFAADSRAPDDIKQHIHESPWTMTLPLIVLAAGAALLGILGLPEIELFGTELHSVLGRWLPTSLRYEPAHAEGMTIWVLMGAASAVAGLGILIGWALYRRGPSRAVHDLTASGPGAWLLKVVQNKFYVDEAYDWIIVRPFRWLGQAVFVAVDRFIIDLLIVDGSAFVIDVLGRITRWFQNGQVQRYLVALVVGGALVFFFATRQTVDFSTEPAGGGAVKFTVELGGGPAAAAAEIGWDFDGDGTIDSASPEVTRSFPKPGTYPVTLRVRSGPFGRTREITRDVTVEPPGGMPAGGAQ